ncbi:MAG TPA: hypothetical protein VIH90_03945 [Candidatus Saccharimonadales bacterium]
MARYIRLYESPSLEKHGNILGFSGGIAEGARDPELHRWLEERGYTATPESEAQTNSILYLAGLAVRTVQYHQAEGIPLPERTVSAGHLLIEPPIRDEDLRPLGEFLGELESINDGGFRMHAFIDNRSEDAEAFDFSPDNLVLSW